MDEITGNLLLKQTNTIALQQKIIELLAEALSIGFPLNKDELIEIFTNKAKEILMKVNKPEPQPTFGKRLTQRQTRLIRRLPEAVRDNFDKKLMACPMDESKHSSNIRDRVIKEVINLAKKLGGKK